LHTTCTRGAASGRVWRKADIAQISTSDCSRLEESRSYLRSFPVNSRLKTFAAASCAIWVHSHLWIDINSAGTISSADHAFHFKKILFPIVSDLVHPVSIKPGLCLGCSKNRNISNGRRVQE